MFKWRGSNKSSTAVSFISPKIRNYHVSNLLSITFLKVRKYPAFGVLIAWLVFFIVFSILGKHFLTLSNLTGVFTVVSELGIMTIGVAFLMISGEFDLSVGAVYAVSSFIFGVLANTGLYSPLAFIITLVFASLFGFINGMVTLRVGIPSFITTLGMMMILRGLLLAITKGATITYEGDNIMPLILAKGIFYGFRPSHLWFIALTLFFTLLLIRTRFGNWVFAAGGGKEAARSMGVNVDRVKLINFMISALMAGLAGCIVISRFNLANPSFGAGLELEVITSAVIGGTLLSGGYGTILGAFLGAFLIGMIRIGLILSGAPGYWYQGFIGIVLIIAATIHLKTMGIKR